MVCTILQEAHAVGPIRTRNFYDDLTSRAVGQGEEIIETIVDHGVRLGGLIAAARLTHNQTKTVVVASTMKIAKEVVHRLGLRHIEVKVDKRTKDLGIDAGGGTRRTVKTSLGRVKKAVGKLKKTAGPVRSNRGGYQVN